MQYRLTTILILAICLDVHVMGQPANAQKKNTGPRRPAKDTVTREKKFILMGKNFGTSVVLRWAPRTVEGWEKANVSGFEIYRFEVDTTSRKQADLFNHPVQLTSTPLRPYTLERWKQQFHPEDTAAAIAAELLYGKKFETSAKTNGRFNWGEANMQRADMENRLGMALFNADLHPDIATGMAWRWEDKTIEKGRLYYYILISPAVNGQPADTASALVSTRYPYMTPVMPQVLSIPWDRTVTLFWNRETAMHQFSAYYLERSDDNGNSFRRLNALPYIDASKEPAGHEKNKWMQYTDSIPRNYKLYLYRVRGVTAFGELSEPSAPVKVAGADKTKPGTPIQVKAEHIKGSQVRISWKKPVIEKDLAGFLVGRGNSANGPFFPLDTVLLPPATQTYIDKYAMTWDKNFYIVAAIDSAGNAARSMPAYAFIIDSIPPAAPIGLTGSIDTAGIVRLHWRWNKEMDLKGYNVYASNDSAKAFYILNSKSITDTNFTDTITIRTLTRHIYYRICAVDKAGNPSLYSRTLRLTKPDIIPPVAPVITHFEVSDSAVVLQWAASSSDDVAWQAVWRRERGQLQWRRIDSLQGKANIYADRHVRRMAEYEYCLTAIDSSGLYSDYSFPLHVRIYDNGRRRGVDTLQLSMTGNKTMQLIWRYSLSDRQHIRFLLYRNYNNGGLELYKNIEGGANEFTDSSLPGAGDYQYALKVITEDGGASGLVSSRIIKLEKQ
jgi:hypothetical protein